MKNNRRQFIKQSAVLTAAGLVMAKTGFNAIASVPLHGDTFSLPPLPYDYAALEPAIDTQTMNIHHSKHHAAYVKNLNELLSPMHLHDITIEQLCKGISKYPVGVRNNGGGHYNHSNFWKWMKPHKGEAPTGKLLEALNGSFGSLEEFKKQFGEAALKRFGSGWAWLVKTADGKLAIGSTANQDNPLMDVSEFKGEPILGLDVWEHAYYLKYQNKRVEYVSAFWSVVNWEEVALRLK